MDGLERVVQYSRHEVHHRGVTHTSAPPGGGHHVRAAAHGLAPPPDRYFGIAQENRLRGGDNRLQARAAEAIHVERGCGVGNARLDCRHAAQIGVPRLGRDDISHDDVVDLVRRHARMLQRTKYCVGSESREWNILEGATETPDGRANRPDNEYFGFRHIQLRGPLAADLAFSNSSWLCSKPEEGVVSFVRSPIAGQ